MNQNHIVYLLSIHGQLAPKTLESARVIHNETAGAPANVAAARSLGDLSHMVYVPIDHNSPEAGEFLILDLWNSAEGLGKFFADPHVQEGGGMIFSQRDPVVWQPAEGFISYHFPAPTGKNERYVGIVRGPVKSQAEARAVHNELVGMSVNQARLNSSLSHEAYFRMLPPGSPESVEFFAVDVWSDAEAMMRHYDAPGFMEGLSKMFTAEPMATVWVPPAGSWVEW